MSSTNTETHLLVQSVMRREPLHLSETDRISEAVETMIANHVSALPVIDEGKGLIGIVSLKDLMPLFDEDSEKVIAVMTTTPVTIKMDATIVEAARLMMKNQVHHLPVLSSEQRLVGVLSATDFARLTADGLLQPAT